CEVVTQPVSSKVQTIASRTLIPLPTRRSAAGGWSAGGRDSLQDRCTERESAGECGAPSVAVGHHHIEPTWPMRGGFCRDLRGTRHHHGGRRRTAEGDRCAG